MSHTLTHRRRPPLLYFSVDVGDEPASIGSHVPWGSAMNQPPLAEMYSGSRRRMLTPDVLVLRGAGWAEVLSDSFDLLHFTFAFVDFVVD